MEPFSAFFGLYRICTRMFVAKNLFSQRKLHSKSALLTARAGRAEDRRVARVARGRLTSLLDRIGDGVLDLAELQIF